VTDFRGIRWSIRFFPGNCRG